MKMDLRHILNPLPDPDDAPRNINHNPHSGEPNATIPPPAVPTSSYLHSKFFLSPRRLDPEIASVSTNSSTKRRRTNRGRTSPDRSKQLQSGTAMGRSFSELEVPSDTSSNDEDNAVVKRGVAQLSLSGNSFFGSTDLRIDEYASLQLGTRVEALKPGTQGTWYVARIVESASFPAHYIDGDEAQEVPSVWYPMVCVHYEGRSMNQSN